MTAAPRGQHRLRDARPWPATDTGAEPVQVRAQGTDNTVADGPAHPNVPESLGRRIARLRAASGLTQQQLADRTAISRVAVSHLEMGISVPSERTVVLLAGVFHLEPDELVVGTAYPEARAERLPLFAARYTEVEHQTALLRRDLDWLARLEAGPTTVALAAAVYAQWRAQLDALAATAHDPGQRALLADARALLSITSPR